MLSTYTSYNLITRDLLTTLDRTAQESANAREEAYYKENIGKVGSIDEFLEDYRLFNYAMKAYGLADMAYATAFMRQVLESDLSDENSFVNRMTDDRYRQFAAAFNFQTETAVAQTEAQLDEVIGLYTASVDNAGRAIQEESRYYNIVIDKVTSVDELLNNERLASYIFTAYDLDESIYSRETLRGVLSSDLSDPNSYFNTVHAGDLASAADELVVKRTELNDQKAQLGLYQALIKNNEPGLDIPLVKAQIALLQSSISGLNADVSSLQRSVSTLNSFKELASAFNFGSDGTTTAGTVQNEAQKKDINEAYTLSNPRVTSAAALLNRANFEEAVTAMDNVDDIVDDERLLNYVKVAYNLTGPTIVPATIRNILTSDPDDPTSYIYTFGDGDENYIALARAFNFQEDGTIAAGETAQTGAQTRDTSNLYMVHYNDADDEADKVLIANYKADVSELESVADFLESDSVFDLSLKAFGLDPEKVSAFTVKQVLLSDLNDPKSYVYRLKDERFVELAKAFNFDAEGNIEVPVLAQSETEILAVSKAYVLEKSRFGTDDDKEKAEAEASYYSSEIQKIASLDEFLANERLVNLVLAANEIDPETVTPEFLRDVFLSDIDDPDSLVNQQADRSWRSIVASFNFNLEGQVVDMNDGSIQLRRGIYETIDNYIRQAMEEDAGEENAGVRLALYFERMASSITSAYDFLADDALYEVFKITYGISDEVGNADVDAQAEMIERYLDLEELQDPEFVRKMIVKFSVLYDAENNLEASGAVAVLSGSTGNISGDLLFSLAQLRTGGT